MEGPRTDAGGEISLDDWYVTEDDIRELGNASHSDEYEIADSSDCT
jgi:hypothetical protein